MSKSFRESYYDGNDEGMKKIRKTSKQKRQRVKDYLRQIEHGGVPEEDEDFELEDETEN